MLHTACARGGAALGEPVGSVPHYVAAATNPKAALALLRSVEGLIGVSVDVSELESAAADYERQVGLAVQSDPDIQAFVERLEQAAESEEETLADRRSLGRHARARIPALPAPARARAQARPASRLPAPSFSAAGQTIR